MNPFVVVGAVVLAVALVLFVIYNRLVHLRNLSTESWRDVDTELQRRYDLVPSLVGTVKGYAAHEEQTFATVTAQRADAMATDRSPDEQAPREQALGQGVAHLLAIAERYPELRASEQFSNLQRQLADTEDRIQVARRIYNANVRAYDSLVQTFPSLIVAKMFGFVTRPYFVVDPVIRGGGAPRVDL